MFMNHGVSEHVSGSPTKKVNIKQKNCFKFRIFSFVLGMAFHFGSVVARDPSHHIISSVAPTQIFKISATFSHHQIKAVHIWAHFWNHRSDRTAKIES